MAEEKKKRPGKRDHLNDFYKDVSGQYVYGGAMYTNGLTPAQHKRFILRLWLCAGGSLLGQIAAGCIPAAGMGDGFWVLPFYLGTIISTIMVCWAMWELTDGGEPMREYIYNASVGKLPRRCEFGMVFGGLSVAGLVIRLIVSGLAGGTLWATVLFVAIQIGTVCALFLVKKMLQSTHWSKK